MLRLAASGIPASHSGASAGDLLLSGCIVGVILAVIAGFLWWAEDRDVEAGYSTIAAFPPIRSIGWMLGRLATCVYVPCQGIGALGSVFV